MLRLLWRVIVESELVFAFDIDPFVGFARSNFSAEDAGCVVVGVEFVEAVLQQLRLNAVVDDLDVVLPLAIASRRVCT